MTLISRDPFARTELHRDKIRPAEVSYAKQSCDWCGNERGDGSMFRYQIEHDGGRVERIRGRFCSVGCMRSYHD